MRVWAVDPGYEQSALVIYDGVSVLEHVTEPNAALLQRISDRTRSSSETLVVEQMASFGMPVGAEVFETVHWAGRFIQAWTGYRPPLMPWDRIKRHVVKDRLCGNQRAKDAHIRQALLDRFGPGKAKAIGLKSDKGPLYGLHGDEWSALSVAVTWWDLQSPAAERAAGHAPVSGGVETILMHCKLSNDQKSER